MRSHIITLLIKNQAFAFTSPANDLDNSNLVYKSNNNSFPVNPLVRKKKKKEKFIGDDKL